MKAIDKCSSLYSKAKGMTTDEVMQTRIDLRSEREPLLVELINNPKDGKLLDRVAELNLFIRFFDDVAKLRGATFNHRLIYKLITQTKPSKLKQTVIAEVKKTPLSLLFELIKRDLEKKDVLRKFLYLPSQNKQPENTAKPMLLNVGNIGAFKPTFKPYQTAISA